jgi:thymidylate synthase
MKQYLESLKYILDNGQVRSDRTGVGTISVFGQQTKYNLQDGFPAMTTKKLFFKGVVHELLWFLSGKTDIRYLINNGVNIWNDNAYDYYLKNNKSHLTKEQFIQEVKSGSVPGVLGPVYGKQWRNWHINEYVGEEDQIKKIINSIKTNPYSRRHMVSAWNVAEVDSCALPPCHYSFQFYVSNDSRLSCIFNMRSVDKFLGESFNIASYALLTHMVAQVCNLNVGEVISSTADSHIYLNHIEQVKEQLKREPLPLPKLWLNPEIKNIDDFKYEDIKLINYNHHSAINAPMAV